MNTTGAEFDLFDAISEHSFGLADAATDSLGALVEHCPGWTVADLVAHLIEVQWFWATIAQERLAAPPEESRRPPRPVDDELVATLRAGAERLVEVLRSARGDEAVWTWAPAQQDIAFITRHQVQEAAVHHWDAAEAAGRSLVISTPVAADAIEEFLTFSVSSADDPAEPTPPSLDGRLVLQCADAGPAWTIGDGPQPGTVHVGHGADADVPTLTGSASDLLLWLYRRVELESDHVPEDLIGRFRALCFTD
ncbi:MAG: maleylpyruvate isomerase family mycothiol-dependent enzyme [Acidimicrobiales bacterium]